MTLPPHALTIFEIQEYYQNEPRFNGVFSRDNLPNNTLKNGAYVINLDEYHDIGTHWAALYVNNKIVTYFDSFGVEHIPKEIMKFINRKKIITNIYRIQAYDSIMYNNSIIFVLDSLILCLMVKAQQITLIFFHQMILIKMMM